MGKMNDIIIDAMVDKLAETMYYDENINEDDEYIKEANDNVYNLFWDNDLFKDIKHDLDFAILNSEIAHQRQGYILGFKKAIAILKGMD